MFYQILDNSEDTSIPELLLTYGDTDKLKDKAVWFLRISSPAENKKRYNFLEDGNDNEIIWGETNPNTILQLSCVMDRVYVSAMVELSSEKDTEAEHKEG
jgi:dynein heavy chain